MPKKILLADDSVTIQKVVELTFAEGDYQITSVSNGKLAVEQLTKDRPDIAIVDIIMPEMSGYEVAEFIKKNPEYSAIPVILLTGTFEPFDEERAKKSGAEAYVTKPFDSKMLVEKVESLLAQKVKVENVEKIPPATIFQSRQEYQVPGVVADRYIEEMKSEQEQEFPKVEELKEEEKGVSSSIAADFIPSVDEIQSPQIEESPAEATAISSEQLPPADFEGFEALAEPPLPTFEETPPVEQVVEEPPARVETPAEEELSAKKDFIESEEREPAQEEFKGEEIQAPQPEFDISERAFEEQPEFPEKPSFEEGVVEIPTPAVSEVEQEPQIEKGEQFSEEGFVQESAPADEVPTSYPQENVIEVGEEKEPSFFESVPSFVETPSVPEAPEIVTDLSEQVMMVAEGQQKAEEFKEEEVQEESVMEEEPPKEFEQPFEPSLPQNEEIPQEEKFVQEEIIEKEEEQIKEEKPLEKEETSLPKVEKVEVSPEIVESVVRKVVEELAPSIIKNIAWEVIPELANTIIKKRIEELEKEAEK